MLDTGDALLGSGTLGEESKGAAIVAAMNLVGYDAMALGPNDLALGLDLLRERMQESEFPMLSANAVLTGSQEAVTDPYTLLEVGGRRVAVIGLTRLPDAPLPDFRVLDPAEAATRAVPEAAELAGTVIVLANLPYEEALALAGAVPGIDLLIAALPAMVPERSVRAPGTGTLVLVADQASPGHSGRRIGVLEATVGPDGALAGEIWRSVWLDGSLADDPEMAALLADYW